MQDNFETAILKKKKLQDIILDKADKSLQKEFYRSLGIISSIPPAIPDKRYNFIKEKCCYILSIKTSDLNETSADRNKILGNAKRSRLAIIDGEMETENKNIKNDYTAAKTEWGKGNNTKPFMTYESYEKGEKGTLLRKFQRMKDECNAAFDTLTHFPSLDKRSIFSVNLDAYILTVNQEIKNMGPIEKFFRVSAKYEKLSAAAAFQNYINIQEPTSLDFQILHDQYSGSLTDGRLRDIVKSYDENLFKQLSKPFTPQKNSTTSMTTTLKLKSPPSIPNAKPPEPQKTQATPEELKKACRKSLQEYMEEQTKEYQDKFQLFGARNDSSRKHNENPNNLTAKNKWDQLNKQCNNYLAAEACKDYLKKPSIQKYAAMLVLIKKANDPTLNEIIKKVDFTKNKSQLLSVKNNIDALDKHIKANPKDSAAKDFQEYISTTHLQTKLLLLDGLNKNHAKALTTGKLGEIVKKIDSDLFTQLEKTANPDNTKTDSPRYTR